MKWCQTLFFPWVVSLGGRTQLLGQKLPCKLCDEGALGTLGPQGDRESAP